MPQQPNYIDNYDHFSGADWNDVINTIFGNNDSECYKLVQPYLDAQEAYLEKIDDIQDDIAAKEDDLNRLEDEIDEWIKPYDNPNTPTTISPQLGSSMQPAVYYDLLQKILDNNCPFAYLFDFLSHANGLTKLAESENTDLGTVNVSIQFTNAPSDDPSTSNLPLHNTTNTQNQSVVNLDIEIKIPVYEHPTDPNQNNYHFNFSAFAEELFHAGQIAFQKNYGLLYPNDLTAEVEAKLAKIYAFYKSEVDATDTANDVKTKMENEGFRNYEIDLLLYYDADNNNQLTINPLVRDTFDKDFNFDLSDPDDVFVKNYFENTALKNFATTTNNIYTVEQPNWTPGQTFNGLPPYTLLNQLLDIAKRRGGC